MVKGESRFGYVRRTPQQLKARATMRSGGFDDYIKREFKKYKVREGKNLIRILQPTWDDPEHYGYDLHINFGVGPDNGSYLSLSRHAKGADPLAEARQKAQREGDEELAKKLAPRDRVGVWLIDRMAEDEGPQFWAMPQSFDKALASACTDEDTGEIIYIDDPVDGCDVRFYKEGTGLATKYPGEKIKLMKQGPLSEDAAQAKEWIDFVKTNPIPDILVFYSYDQISAVFNGASKPVDDDQEVDLRPRAVASKRVQVDDEEDEDVPAPRRRMADPDDEDQEVEPKAKSHKDEDEDEGGSIRERLRRRREKLQEEA